MFTVQVDIKRVDLLRMNLFLNSRLKVNRVFFVLYISLVISASIFLMHNFSAMKIFLSVLFSIILGVPAFLLLVLVMILIGVFFASERSGLGEHIYTIEEDGLRETTRLNQDFSKWVAFERVWCDREYIFLQRSWAAYHLFPKRCFGTKEEFEKFGATLKQKIPS